MMVFKNKNHQKIKVCEDQKTFDKALKFSGLKDRENDSAPKFRKTLTAKSVVFWSLTLHEGGPPGVGLDMPELKEPTMPKGLALHKKLYSETP